jgi:DNA-binding transcriptional regulator YiaG
LTYDISRWYNRAMKPEELKKWRKGSGYTQGELADILSVVLMTVSRWECGTRAIPSFLHLALKAIPKKGGDKKQRSITKLNRKEVRHGTKRDL